MKIHEIIRKLRIENNSTQEQVANYLGVTAPAVHKWEKGIFYPDIALFLNQLSAVIEANGFEEGYALAMEKLKEYPTCDALIFHTAMILDGAQMLCSVQKEYAKQYVDQIKSLYERAAKGNRRRGD